MFLKIISIIVSFILVSGIGYTPVKYSPKDKDSLKGSVVILSDTHIESNNFERFPRIAKILAGAAAAEVKPDVIAFAGDNTMNGQDIEWFDFYGFVSRYIKGSKALVAFGNHDFGNTADHDTYVTTRESCIKNYNSYLGNSIDNVYYSYDTEGCKYIVLGSEDNAEDTVQVITDEQIEWLRAQLADAAEKGIPAIVINHNLIEGKNGERSEYDFNLTDNDAALDSALKQCDTTVLYVCGHSHFGVSESSIATEENVTYINLPSSGNVDNYEAEDEYADAGVGIYVEIYEDSLVVTFRNFIEGKALNGYENIVIDR